MATATRTNGRGAVAYEHEPAPRDENGLLDRVLEQTRSTRDMEVIAKRAAASRMFAMDENQIFTLMLLCEAEGLHPVEALRRYHVIQGRPAMRSDAILGEMMRHGWIVEWRSDSRDRQAQEAVFTHARKCPNSKSVSWTAEDAKTAGLANKDNWRNHTAAMLRARVISTGCRMLDPGIIAGIYSDDEVEEIADRDAKPQDERSRIISALDEARGRKAAEPEDTPASPPKFSDWLTGRLAQLHEQWTELAAKHGADPGKAIPPEQVTNALISDWLADGTLEEATILNNKGTRDRAKCKAIILHRWEHDTEGLQEEVEGYLKGKYAALAAEKGVPSPSETPIDADSDELQGMADEDPAEDFALNQ